MGFFDIFFGKAQTSQAESSGGGPNEVNEPEIPRELFVEDRDPGEIPVVDAGSESIGIEGVYAYMLSDFEGKGYRDALSNADTSAREDNVRLIQLELQIRIERAKLHYEDRIKEIDAHIASRSQAGLLDLAQELQIRKGIYLGHLEALSALLKDLVGGGGMTYRVVHSYLNGHKRGLSTITYAKILNSDT